jgi:hypothetical protein
MWRLIGCIARLKRVTCRGSHISRLCYEFRNYRAIKRLLLVTVVHQQQGQQDTKTRSHHCGTEKDELAPIYAAMCDNISRRACAPCKCHQRRTKSSYSSLAIRKAVMCVYIKADSDNSISFNAVNNLIIVRSEIVDVTSMSKFKEGLNIDHVSGKIIGTSDGKI